LFGGYRKHQAAWAIGVLSRMPRPLAQGVGRLAGRGPDVLRRAARTLRAEGPAERLLAMSGDIDDDRRRTLFRGPLAETDGTSAAQAVLSHVDGDSGDPLTSTLFLDAQLALPDLMLHYFDRTSMAHSLEARVPFLDHEFVELSASIPARYKVRRWERKVVLREMARELLPHRVLTKPKVGFFVGASDEWLRTRLSAAVGDRLLGHELRCAEFLDPGALNTLVTDFLERRSDAPRARLLLAVLMLEIWLSSYLSRALSTPVSAAP
jgi:asparagine synthase (glutamine-hydrolysing)